MEMDQLPHRCPKCNALVVDRRSRVCTTCHTALPKEWVIDQEIRAEHSASLNTLDPRSDPKMPAIIRFLNSSSRM